MKTRNLRAVSRALDLCLYLGLMVSGASQAVATGNRADEPRRLVPDPLSFVAPSRPFATHHIALDLDVDIEKGTISGSVTHRLQSLEVALRSIRLNAVGLTIDEVTVEGAVAAFRYPVRGTRVTSWIQQRTPVATEDELVIELPRPAELGQIFTVEVRYHGAPTKGLYFMRPEEGLKQSRFEVWSQGEGEDNRYWIPCHDYPDEKATFEGRFRVAHGYYAMSNGILVERVERGDRTEFHWRMDQPQVSYLIMLAAAAYDIHEEEYAGVPLMVLVPPGTPKEFVDRGYGLTRDVMDFYTKEIGIDYPFGKYAQVVVQEFIWGGMENSTATVMNDRSLYDAGTALTRDAHGLIAHELAHQWWGDMVTCREWSHMWLNEGFATYYNLLYQRHDEGEESFEYALMDVHRAVVEADREEARPLVVDFFNRKDAQNSANVYIKGSSVLHMLRYQLGDELYRQAIRRYGTDRRFQLSETSDLVRAVREVSGQNLDWFFEQWTLLQGHPIFDVTDEWDEKDGMLRLRVQQTQQRDELTPLFRTPVDIEFTLADGRREVRRIQVDGADQSFSFALPSRPKMVVFDPAEWILKDLRFRRTPHELIEQLGTGGFVARVRAARALGDVAAREDVIKALREVLFSDGFWGLRREAALALGRLASADAVTALLTASRGSEGRVRLATAEALATVKLEPGVVTRLEELLNDDPAWEVRAAALRSLVELRAEGAAKICRKALAQDSFRGVVRVAALDGLQELDDKDALKEVKLYAGPGNPRSYRHTAIGVYAALAKEGNEQAKAEAAKFLGTLLDDWYLRTRETVIDALVTLGSTARPYLARAMRNDPVDDVRTRAEDAVRTLDEKVKAKDTGGLEQELAKLKDKVEHLEKDLVEVRERALRGAEANQ